MDIINELEIGNIENNFQDAIEYIEQQKEIWEKKSYIFNVIRLVNVIKQLHNEGMFELHNIEFINLLHKYNGTNGNCIGFEFYNSEEDINIIFDGKYIEPYNKIANYFDALDKFNEDYIQEQDFEVGIILRDDIKKQIFNVLLSQELRTAIGYSEMQLELENGSTHQMKKLKL